MVKQHFVPQIQTLRAIAVVLVLLFHGNLSWFPGGYVGVDVFFVISGYLITGLLLRELGTHKSINFSSFYARRIRRLLPAAAVVLIVTTLGAWYGYSPLDFKQYTSTAIATALYLSNFWFAHVATDYLATDAHNNPLLHTWSLSVEEQFYMLWPLLMLLLYRLGAKTNTRQVLLIGLALISLVSFVASLRLTDSNQPLAFFGSPTRAWEFGVGGLIAMYFSTEVRFSGAIKIAITLLGLALILICSVLYTNQTVFPGLAATVPVIGTALVIIGSQNAPDSLLTRWMQLPLLQFTGNISYSLYLWHWPLIVVLNAFTQLGQATALLIYFCLSIALATATYILVENPVRFNQRLSRSTFASFAFGAVLIIATAGTAYAMRTQSIKELSSPEQRIFLQAADDIPVIYHDGCHLPISGITPGKCYYGDVDAMRKIVLFGDSHAAQWFPALNTIAQQRGYALISLTKSGCPSMSFEPFNRALNRPYTECTQWREQAFKRIKSLAPELVVISNSSQHAYIESAQATVVDNQAWSRAVEQTYARLSAAGTKIVLIRDTPALQLHAPSCLSKAVWKKLDPSEQCTFSVTSVAQETVFEIEANSLLQIDNSIVVDMTPYICAPGSTCSVQRGELVLFHDDNHLTARFSRSLANSLSQQIYGDHNN